MKFVRANSLYLIFTTVTILFLAVSWGWSANQANEISLAKAYPPETLKTLLLSQNAWRPFPAIHDRDAWENVPEAIRAELLAKAVEDATKPLLVLPASVYLEFKRNGNRSNYQNIWSDRRSELASLVVGECIENQGRFMDAIADRIWAICEETSWTWPAHISPQKAGTGLPDVDDQVVALFSAQTANTLALASYLLGDKLDDVSPLIRPRIHRELDRRIFTPFLDKNFGWMGYADRAREEFPNNWNPWIVSNVLISSLLMEQDEARRIEIAYKCLDCLDNFLTFYPSDGSCDEGPSYWGRAGASLFDALEHLYSASAGKLSVYDHPLIQEIGRFIYRAHITESYFVCVGDCDPRSSVAHELVYRYGKRIGDKHLQEFGAHGITPETLNQAIPSSSDLNRFLYGLFHASAMLEANNPPMPLVRDVWLGNPYMQLMTARDSAGTSDGFFLAAWGAHNAQSHNHNDVGNFVIFVDGHPLIIDIGRPEYTRQTFSSQRYEIWAFQSGYHNLPTLNGKDQLPGRSYEATAVTYQADEGMAQLVMDLTKAYPEEAGIQSWVRTVQLNRGKDITLHDHYQAQEATDNLVENLITPCPVTLPKAGQITFALPGEGQAVRLEYDPDQLEAEIETIEIEDRKLASEWGKNVYRIRLKTMNAQTEDTLSLRFTR